MNAAGGRSRVLLLALLVLLVAGWAIAMPSTGSAAESPARSVADSQQTPDSLKLVTVDENSSEQLWPYTSRRQSYDSATLPINVVVLKNADFVRHLLSATTAAEWEVSDTEPRNASGVNASNVTEGNQSSVESGVVLNGTEIEWSTARGSTRYTYLHNRETGQGRWIDETYQLHDGTYLGTRYHLRLYEGGEGDDRWTAIQVHREHWDWFRLRHTVDSVDRGQDYLEGEFFGTWFLEDITRVRVANAGALDSDGWVSFIRLTDRGITAPSPASLVFLIGFVSFHRLTERYEGRVPAAQEWLESAQEDLAEFSVDPMYIPLVVSLALFPLVVRMSGITLEEAFPALSPKVFAAVLYPALVLGIPACAIAFAWRLRPLPSAVAAAVAFGGGLLLDYAYLNIAVLPIGVIVNRTGLLFTVGLVAAGSSLATRDDLTEFWLVGVGLILWLFGLAVPLFGLA